MFVITIGDLWLLLFVDVGRLWLVVPLSGACVGMGEYDGRSMTSGAQTLPIWLLFFLILIPILIPTVHSNMFRDPWTVNSGFRRNSAGIPE